MRKNWLKQRSEILARYAESLPSEQDRITITFDYPDYGWMPVHFYKNGQAMGSFNFSYVYDCFVPLREWLELIASIEHDKACAVNLDCEDYHLVLYYDPIWFFDFDSYKGKIFPPHCGIFSVYDEYKDSFILDAFCYTMTFVGDIYKCIIDFAKAMKKRPEFIDDWISTSFNHEWGEIDEEDPAMNQLFIKKVRSPKIQEYLRYMKSWYNR